MSKITESIINKIGTEAKIFFRGASGCHDWTHVERVKNLALRIAKKEKADAKIVEIAALLHDIGRKEEMEQNGTICHAQYGAELAQNILQKHGIGNLETENILHCIKSHRFRNNLKPETAEAKCLYDADKLDSIGATGIGRAFMFASKVNAKLHDKNVNPQKTKIYSEDDSAYREYLVKLRKIKNKIFTGEGKKIANERHKFMSEFFSRLNKEVEGKL